MGAFNQTLLLRRFRNDMPASPADPAARFTRGREAREGWNPYRQLPFRVRSVPTTTGGAEVLIANGDRAYLLLQNQGPGNLYVQFGSSADLSSLLLVPTQVYEMTGGGPGGAYVHPESIWAIADLPDTTCLVGEGIYIASRG